MRLFSHSLINFPFNQFDSTAPHIPRVLHLSLTLLLFCSSQSLFGNRIEHVEIVFYQMNAKFDQLEAKFVYRTENQKPRLIKLNSIRLLLPHNGRLIQFLRLFP